jgi:hypothetical protein
MSEFISKLFNLIISSPIKSLGVFYLVCSFIGIIATTLYLSITCIYAKNNEHDSIKMITIFTFMTFFFLAITIVSGVVGSTLV